jgi:carbon monoxide dehydrogenase subunit G
MANYVTTVESPLSPQAAFDYMSDLRNFERWDPGVRSATQVVGVGGGPESSFDVSVASVGPDLTLRYETIRYEPDHLVVVEARSRMFTSTDQISIRSEASGSVVTYEAELRLNGPFSVFDPFLRLVFKRIGDRAAAGLKAAIGAGGRDL